jgi:hypothetical protein
VEINGSDTNCLISLAQVIIELVTQVFLCMPVLRDTKENIYDIVIVPDFNVAK